MNTNKFILLLLSLLLTACSSSSSSTEEDETPTDVVTGWRAVLKDCGTGGNAIRIMPIGDSITESRNGYSSYRYWLWRLLQDNGCNVDFVGGRRGVSDGRKGGGQRTPSRTNFDQDHQSYWGLRADEVLNRAPSFAETYVPNVALIHLGTNDMFQNQSTGSTIDEIANIVSTLRAFNPDVVVIIAQVIPSTRSISRLVSLNAQIPVIAAQLNNDTSPVVHVDQFANFSANSDTFDGVHPDDSGEQKMAQNWFNAFFALVAQAG